MIIKGAKVFNENFEFEEKDICIANGLFSEQSEDDEVIDATGLYAIPGLVDIHFHGAVGHDFCDASMDGLREIAEYEASCGITAICPATMTYSEEILSGICDVAREFANRQAKGLEPKAAELVGIHMEGPFLSPNKLGAQNPEYVQLPNVEMFRRLQERSGGLFKIVDIAPETDGAMEFIEVLKDEVRISLAHNTSDYETAKRAFAAGASHLTHTYNAMPGITHREPGPIVAGYEAGAEAEIIADGIHIHDAIVRMTFDLFGAERMILIADSMEATGLSDGSYQLGGQAVTKKGNLATLTEHPDTIAGSVTNLYDCMKHAVLEMGVKLEDAVRAATINPAKSIGIDRQYGSIEIGKKARLVLMDEHMNRKLVI